MEKYYNEEGKVGVLYSPGYGAGWSTLAYDNENFLVFDKTLVTMALKEASEEEVEEYLKTKGINTYTGGWRDIEVIFMEPNTPFLINEYDGSESIEYLNDIVPYIA